MQPTSFPSIGEANQIEEEKQLTRNQRKRQNKHQTEQSRQTEKKAENTALQKLKDKETEVPESANLKTKEAANITPLVVQEMVFEEQPQGAFTEESQSVQASLDLKTQVNNLSAEIQELFNKELRENLRKMAGHQIAFSTDNERYQKARAEMGKESVRAQYRELRDRQQAEYRSICDHYERMLTLFNDRIKAVQNAIKNHVLESALLKEIFTGNVSYLSSMSLISLSLGYKYGIPHRLSECTNKDGTGALDIRRERLGLKLEDKSVEDVEFSTPIFSDIQRDTAELSRKIDILKEEVTVCNEAMRKEAYREVSESNLPAIYYLYHHQQLMALRKEIEGEKGEKETVVVPGLKAKAQDRIKELDKTLDTEKGTPDSELYISALREKTELTTRWEMIELRYKEIVSFLNQRKSDFKLSDKKLEDQQAIKLENLSAECATALKLLGRITALKEDTVLSNQWEDLQYASSAEQKIEKRKVAYFQASKEYSDLAREKSTFETETLPKRQEYLASAVDTYREYIRTMQLDMEKMDNHFKLLGQAAQERAKWQVQPLPAKPVTQTKPEPLSVTKPKEEAKESSGGFWRSLFGSSTQVEKKPEVDAKSPSTTSTDEKNEKKPVDNLAKPEEEKK
jgi:hypothetical protein